MKLDCELSGDNFNKLCTCSIYDRNYYNKYITSKLDNVLFINEDNSKLFNSIKNNKNIIFAKVEYLDYFVSAILPFLNEKFILITHNGDMSSGNNNTILNNNLLVKWYGQNMNNISNKTHGIPIGLMNKIWNMSDVDVIDNCRYNPKIKLLYLNFTFTNPNRKNIQECLLNNGFSKNNHLSWNKYIEELSSYKFAASPPGNGIDCHRTWECLYLGVIPIVLESNEMSFFDDLPILFVKSYNIITKEYLEKIYNDKFKNKTYNLDKLSILYWKKIISF